MRGEATPAPAGASLESAVMLPHPGAGGNGRPARTVRALCCLPRPPREDSLSQGRTPSYADPVRSTMNAPSLHPAPDALRSYALGQLDESEAARICEHLVVCPDCLRTVQALVPGSVLTDPGLVSGAETDPDGPSHPTP